MLPLKNRLAAELIGTFFLVFAGTGAIVVNDVTMKSISHVGIALTFGLVVLALIYALGDVSGAHFNPAVTVAFVVAKRFPMRDAAPYVAAQFAGALLASFTLYEMFPEHYSLGATLPWAFGTAEQSFVLELLLTAFLMFVILCVSTGAKEKGIMAGIAIGSVIALEAMFAGPISGASMNPARSLAPAVFSGKNNDLHVYIIAPTVGALLAVGACWLVQMPGCCSSDAEGGCK